jgi:glycosyltransferase involved in cell wall biosynthesis
MSLIKLSVIVPFYNEEENLADLHQELVSVLGKQKYQSEVVYVNDGSIDNSTKRLTKAIKAVKSDNVLVKLVEFKKNFGQTAAVSAGIDNSEGKYVSFLDADLQNDPKDIPHFMDKLGNKYDAVFGWRKDRKDATVRSFLSRAANKVINWVFKYPYHDVGCSARVVKREFVEELELYGELHRIMPILIYLKGARVGEIIVKHRKRAAGYSKYGPERIIKTIIDILTVKFLHSYGAKPAYVFGSVGLGSFTVSGLVLLAVAYRKIFRGVFVHKDPLFLIAIFFGLLGMQFILMGLLAELQVRTYFSSKKNEIFDIKSIDKY